jgi:hypothetical protein
LPVLLAIFGLRVHLCPIFFNPHPVYPELVEGQLVLTTDDRQLTPNIGCAAKAFRLLPFAVSHYLYALVNPVDPVKQAVNPMHSNT